MKRKVIFCATILMLIAFTTICVFASTGYLMKYYPGTSDTVTNLPEEELQITNPEYTVSSQIPVREGYEFLGWVLDYKIGYSVTYVVNPDPYYGIPEDITTPVDEIKYEPGENVHVVEQLTTTIDCAFNDKGEKISGTWKFTPWDKEDFTIYEDTMITGGWTFTPAPPPTKYKYTVHYVLFDDYLHNKTTNVAKEKTDWVDKLDIEVTEVAKTGNDLLAKYRKNYEPVPGYESVTKKIEKDDYHIYIFYQKKSSSS